MLRRTECPAQQSCYNTVENQMVSSCCVHVTITVAMVCSEDLRSTISLLLSVEAASRPSAQDVLKLPSVKQQSAQLCIQLEDNTLQASARVTRQSTDKATLVTGGLSQKGPTRTRVSKEPPAQPKSPEGTKG